MRQRVRELAARSYDESEATLDYVLLFIPNESVYSFIHEHDPAMVDTALGQRVVLCSPFTLFAVLAVIRQTVDSWRLEQASDEILRLPRRLHPRVGPSSPTRSTSSAASSTARSGAYDELAGTRRRVLQRRIDQVDDLRTRRGLPGDISGAPVGDRVGDGGPARRRGAGPARGGAPRGRRQTRFVGVVGGP